ncbi:MAG: gfo/Idh/MocA family oxidoreductase [Boseongicola sp.]|nr:MAG: gfo/Idh/MocA family oxidoreductase [Boseongicola sp.]
MKRIAVVGAGLIGQKHIEIVRANAVLDAIIDPTVEARELASKSDTKWFKTVDDYLKFNHPDGAIIATPNQLHHRHGAAFITAGIPTLIEKPLADCSDSALKIVELSRESNVAVLVGHHRRHSPFVKAAKTAIESGNIGRLVTVNAQFWLLKPDEYFNVVWRKQAGAGPTFINLIHDIDLLRHFCGDITAVQASESHSVRGYEVEDTSAVILEFDTGVLGTVSISDTVVAPWSWELTAGENPAYPKTEMSCYMLGGTKGSLSVPDLSLWQHPGKQSWWSPIEVTKPSVKSADPVKEQFLHFLDVIENNVQPLVSAEEGFRNLQVLDAIKKAARHGRKQRICDKPF